MALPTLFKGRQFSFLSGKDYFAESSLRVSVIKVR